MIGKMSKTTDAAVDIEQTKRSGAEQSKCNKDQNDCNTGQAGCNNG